MENNEVRKPILVAKEDFCSNITKIVNESGLPLYLIEYILKDFLNEVIKINQQCLKNDRLEYENKMKELNKETM